MKKSFINLSNIEKKFLSSLLEDGTKTDSNIAKELGISKSTAGRVRKRLMKNVIKDFIPVVDLGGFGINVFMVVLFEWKGFKNKEYTQKMLKDLENDPSITFLGTGEGSGFTTVLFLGFSDLSEAHSYFNEFRKKYENELGNIISFFIPGDQVRKQDVTDLLIHKLKKILGVRIYETDSN